MYRHVVVAGTFDRLHVGHERVLSKAFEIGELVVIGLTSDEYIRKHKISNFQFPISKINKRQISNFQTRKRGLERFLKKKNWLSRASIFPLDDPYGPVVPNSPHDPAVPEVEAIVVSTETRGRAEEINTLRKEAGWKSLDIIEVPMVPAQDLRPVSSSRVRKHEIDRKGRLVLPDNLRPELQQPMGRVLAGEEISRSIASKQGQTPAVIAVGDVATKTFLDAGITPELSIIDGKVERKLYTQAKRQLLASARHQIHVKSGPGYISQEAMRAIQTALGTREKKETQYTAIVVDGEEDLLALPAIAAAPEGSLVYYGQPRKGMVEVLVTEEKKKQAVALLSRFVIQ